MDERRQPHCGLGGPGLNCRAGAITVHIPLTFRKRGGRKLGLTPDGRVGIFRRPRNTSASALTMALATPPRPGHSLRILKLTLLAPDIVEAVLDGRQPACSSLMIC